MWIKGALLLGVINLISGEIVGGVEVSIQQFPYQVSVQYFQSHICSGTIIGVQFVLTAAHCTDGLSADYLSIRYASNNKNSGGYILQVGGIIEHPEFDPASIDNDVAVLKTIGSIQYSHLAQPIQLADPYYQNNPPSGAVCSINGWGSTSKDFSNSDLLQTSQVSIRYPSFCQSRYRPSFVSDFALCATSPEQNVCQDDSGGPLVCYNKQFGIASWGFSCSDSAYPGVYTNVAYHRNFILDAMKL